jgi:hypothetical protein
LLQLLNVLEGGMPLVAPRPERPEFAHVLAGVIPGYLSRLNIAERQPFVFCVYPWEVDPGQPRMHTASRTSRFRHYVNLGRNERKLDRLLQHFRFGRLCDVISEAGSLWQEQVRHEWQSISGQ